MNQLSQVDRVAQEHFLRKIKERTEQYPDVPVIDVFPGQIHSRKKWHRLSRKVKTGEKPKFIVAWEHDHYEWEFHQNLSTGEERWTLEKVRVLTPINIYSIEQTRVFKKHARTAAIEKFWDIFCKPSNFAFKVPYTEDGPKTWRGKITEEELARHIRGMRDVAIRMSAKTRFIGIDHDLHGGDELVFKKQLRVLLKHFWGKDTWHLQVKEHDAGGVHLFQVFPNLRSTKNVVSAIRQELHFLDSLYPELANEAIQSSMKTFSELEVKPTETVALRLPLASGRTMLIDRPLSTSVYRGKSEPDIVGYTTWLESAIKGEAEYMVAEDVFNYVSVRLFSSSTQETTTTPINSPPPNKREKETPPKVKEQAPNNKGMKNQSWKLITEAWSGEMKPDTLNHWIRQLSLYTPFKFSGRPDDAIQAIEKFVDQLPCWAFSDRLTNGERKKVSAVICHDVEKAFAGWPDQKDPEKAARKLKAAWAKWKSTGRDPFDKTTWTKFSGKSSYMDIELGDGFDFTSEELEQLEPLAQQLSTTVENLTSAVRCFVGLVKIHPEIPSGWIVELLNDQGIPSRSHRQCKHKKFVDGLIELRFVYLQAVHSKGRCRRYGIGKSMAIKFLPVGEQYVTPAADGARLDELEMRFRKLQPTLFKSDCCDDVSVNRLLVTPQ